MPGEVELRLYRDSLSTPWGFRLNGGKDLSSPLVVQRVNVGTPSDGELQSGDVILQIQGSDASRLTHLQAQEQIRKAGGSLLLRILRFGSPIRNPQDITQVAVQKSVPWTKPSAPEYGIDFAKNLPRIPLPHSAQPPPQPGFMLNRVKNTLSGVSYGEPYAYEGDLTPTRLHLSSNYQPPDAAYNISAPHLEAGAPVQHDQRPWAGSLRSPGGGGVPVQHVEPEAPAWAGSLRSSGVPLDSDKYIGPRPHSPKVQTVHYAPGQAPQYRQHAAGPGDAGHDSNTVRAAHLQYNSPLGLYSKASAQEALHTQLHGKPGEGTIQILSESDVHPSAGREDAQQRGASAGSAAGRLHSHQPDDTQVYQSPSLRLLESQLAADDAIGHSDF